MKILRTEQRVLSMLNTDGVLQIKKMGPDILFLNQNNIPIKACVMQVLECFVFSRRKGRHLLIVSTETKNVLKLSLGVIYCRLTSIMLDRHWVSWLPRLEKL